MQFLQSALAAAKAIPSEDAKAEDRTGSTTKQVSNRHEGRVFAAALTLCINRRYC
jgi:hypothetical protein